MTKINIDNLIDYFSVLILILCSGSLLLYFQNYVISLMLLMIVCSVLLLHDKKNRRINIHRSKISTCGYLILYLTIVSTNVFLIHTDHLDNWWISYIMNAIFAFIIITRFPFHRFKKLYINVVFILAVISVIVFYACELEVINPRRVTLKGASFLMVMGHTLGGTELFHRNAGVFHEPGAFQYCLNFALLLLLPDILNKRTDKLGKFKFWSITTCVVSTYSTMGYIILTGVIGLIFFYSDFTHRHKKYVPFMLFVFAGFVYLVSMTPVVNKKIGTDSYGNEHVSKYLRTLDLFTQTQMTLEKPIGGYGIATKSFAKRNHGQPSGCIGLVNSSASLGLIWLILYLSVVYKSIKKMNLGVPTFFVFLLFCIIECNENYVELPISYIFVFHFLNYDDNKYSSHKVRF